MRFKRILTATVVVSPRKVVVGEGHARRGDTGVHLGGLTTPGERVRGRQTQPPILPEAAGSTEIGHRAPVSMPYRPHSLYTSPYAPPPSPVQRRPGAAWFAVGGALLLVAVVLFGVAMFRFVRTISHTDAVFPA